MQKECKKVRRLSFVNVSIKILSQNQRHAYSKRDESRTTRVQNCVARLEFGGIFVGDKLIFKFTL